MGKAQNMAFRYTSDELKIHQEVVFDIQKLHNM